MAGPPTLAVHISLTLRPKSVYSNLAEELLIHSRVRWHWYSKAYCIAFRKQGSTQHTMRLSSTPPPFWLSPGQGGTVPSSHAILPLIRGVITGKGSDFRPHISP